MEHQRKTVSHSEVEQYLRCNRAHYYSYGLGITSRHTGDALKRGTAGHKIVEAGVNAYAAGDKMWDAMQAEYQRQIMVDPELITLIDDVIKPLRYFADEWFPAQEFVVISVEKEMVLPISDELEMPFVTDYALQDRWGSVRVFDAKFQYDFFSAKHLAMLPQLPKYAGAMQLLGVPVNGVGYLQFRYRGRKDDTGADRFRVTNLPITSARIQQTFKEQVMVADRIQEVKQQDLYTWSQNAPRVFNNKVCESCQFFSLCSTELNEPEKTQSVLDMDYVKRERRSFSANGPESSE
jgi:CRISPR/Cas system-associated exonuclease Cas4 (RecB family)